MDFGSREDTVSLNADEKPHLANARRKSNSGFLYGIDISHYQGDLMEKISGHDSLAFVICKATQGETYLDNDFRENWREIRAKGFIRGAYHFYMCDDDPVRQADFFAESIEGIDADDIAPIIDIEQAGLSNNVNDTVMQKDILIFLKRLEAKTGRKPIIYTDYAFAQEYFTDHALLEYDLWLAEYSGRKRPAVPDLWKSKGFKIWQRSDTYHAYSENIDLDIHFGTVASLVK